MKLPLRLVSLFLLAALPLRAAGNYQLGPDSFPQPGVPAGKVTQHQWRSKIYAGTTRDYWVYVPAQYDGTTPAAVMVFQ
jgi:poly(3-hydroxybutyrate) depolymerase